MNSTTRPVFLFLAFANDRVDPAHHLRNLPEEQRRVRAAMAPAVQAGICEVVERANATVEEVFDVFQAAGYRDRVAVFHFGGHAGSGALLFESREGAATAAHAEGLARFLGEQRGLELVFLNGCSSQGQVQGLLDAGVHAVIATSQSIDDEVATELSTRFYRALAAGIPIRSALAQAVAAIQTQYGVLTPRNLHPHPVPPLPAEDNSPWNLYVGSRAKEGLETWGLPKAAGDDLFGLPPLPTLDLPPSPFKHLAPFTPEDAQVFFGRGREIRELFEAVTLPDGAPIVLLFGAAGVGKSSLLAAGLLPRLESSSEVLYLRRDGTLGLTGTLARALSSGTDSATPEAAVAAAWRRRESPNKTLIVILDQAEEAWTRPLPSGTEAAELAAALRSLFAARQARPRGRLLLSFRKEWLAEVLRLLESEKLPRTQVEVAHLDLQGITEAVAGLSSNERLRHYYHLGIEPDLPGLLAGDLLEDPAATIAPALQILLTKMWSQAFQASPAAPRFTVELYQDMKRRGILLDDFVEDQIRELRDWRSELVNSGLVLDLLAHHTTPLGSAETRQVTEVVARYGGRQDVRELLQQCQDRYLLTGSTQTTRLAHDTLAPLVRRRFEASNLPGQRALRILQERAREWDGGTVGPALDAFDLTQVEAGQSGMRVPTPDEERLVAASRRQAERRRRQRRSLQLAAVVAVTIILGAALLAWWQRQQALASEERSRDRARAALAANLLVDRPTEAGLILLETQQPDTLPTASATLHEALVRPLEFATLKGHISGVLAASFSPDGTRIVTASGDKTARIWNATTGQPIATLKGHTARVLAASFTPDGTQAVTASEDNTVRIWNAATGHPIATLRYTFKILAASFSPDSTRVVTSSGDKTARIWNAATGQLIAILHGPTDEVSVASFSSDGTRVVTASGDNRARVWNTATGHPIATLTGHAGEVFAASFSPDGTQVVTASEDNTARIWNAATGHPIATLTGHTDTVSTACFSPDGTRVVTASQDNTARIWNAATGHPTATLTGHTDWVWTASFSPDGTRVVTASKDNTARVWNVNIDQPIATLTGHAKGVFAVSFSPDGTRVVTASQDNTAWIWNTATGLPIVTLKGHTEGVFAASFSPDGFRVVTASEDKTARIWNPATGQLIVPLIGHTGPIFAASFSSDGTRVVTASEDRTARIWNATTGQPLATLIEHGDQILAASFSPDGLRVVTASKDNTARIWNPAIGQPIATLMGHNYGVLAASFSPDGTQVATASRDNTARIWNAATGHLIATLAGHTGTVFAASFSPDGTRVVTASQDKTARIWNAASGQPIATLTGHTGIVFAASFSPDGTRVVTASQDKTARIFSTAGEHLQSRVRARTALCLRADFRQVTLGESPHEAEAHEKACKACVPKFFARLKGVPSGDWQHYVSAWKEYRGCLVSGR